MANNPGKSSSAPAKPAESSAAGEAAAGVIRVVLADTQAIFRVGLRKIFALEDDLRVVGQAESLEQALVAIQKFPADILLLEDGIAPSLPEAVSELTRRAPTVKIVILMDEHDEAETLECFRRGARGIISRTVPPELLVKCVRKVQEGETWLDNRGINWIIEAYRSQAAQLTTARPRSALTEKETRIVSLVTQGLKNKEIAEQIGTTEQVVKNYLRKVYDKLGVSDRLELALYCVHHRLLQPAEAREAEAAQPKEPPVAPAPERA
jgi:DNA-binding NarL/FixJ family response regulator